MRYYLLDKSAHEVDTCCCHDSRYGSGLGEACDLLFGRNPHVEATGGIVVSDLELEEAQRTPHYPRLKSLGA